MNETEPFSEHSCLKPLDPLYRAIDNTSPGDMLLFMIAEQKHTQNENIARFLAKEFYSVASMAEMDKCREAAVKIQELISTKMGPLNIEALRADPELLKTVVHRDGSPVGELAIAKTESDFPIVEWQGDCVHTYDEFGYFCDSDNPDDSDLMMPEPKPRMKKLWLNINKTPNRTGESWYGTGKATSKEENLGVAKDCWKAVVEVPE